MNVGLVVCRYGDCMEVGHGACVAGDVSGPHFECKFRLVVFKPFVDEVCLGRITKSTAEGIQVSCGFFQEIFVPAYWMLRPSQYEVKTGLWVWTPDYSDDAEDEEKQKNGQENGDNGIHVKTDSNIPVDDGEGQTEQDGNDEEDDSRFEMDLGATIRFKVKAINFTQINKTAKGLQATTTTTSTSPPSLSSSSGTAGGSASSKRLPTPDEDDILSRPVRRRSSSVGLDESEAKPPSMQIVASICEDGLGLTSWWEAPGDEEDDEAEEPVENGCTTAKSELEDAKMEPTSNP